MNEETKSIDLVNPVELAKIATPQPKPAVPIKPVAPTAPAKPAAKPTPPTPPTAAPAPSPLAAFSALVAAAPKEHLPTMLAKLGQRCINEKVFANPRAMALAIEGAVRVK